MHSNVRSSLHRGVLLAALVAIAGCGGGGGGDTQPTNQAPIADAGADQTVELQSPVTLNGSGTDADGTVTAYAWTQVSGTAVSLSGGGTSSASFTAPNAEGALVFRLTVTDDDGATDTDDVTVTVQANQAPTAGAGGDQQVAAGAVVALSGTGSDADGTVAAYAWTQLSGPAVTLSNAATQNASFTAPATAATLVFELTVTDDDGATGSDQITVTVVAGGANVSVSGRATFDLVPFATGGGLDLNNPVQSPIRRATVQLLDAGNGVLATSVTDSNGEYQFAVAANTQVRVRVRAEMVQQGTPGWDFRVVDNTQNGALYVLDSALFDSGTGAVQDLHAATGWGGNDYTGVRAAAPFAILDSVRLAFEKFLAVDGTLVFSPLQLNWSVNNVPSGGNTALGQIGTSYYSNNNIYILGAKDVDTDEFDDHVVIHEWGHYYEDTQSRADNIGGAHGGGDILDMRVAYGEGFGNALSGIVTDDPRYRDSFGSAQASSFTINVDSNSVTNPGWYSESSVQSILYDLYDSDADGVDAVALGLAPLHQVWRNGQRTTPLLTSIFTFISELKAEQPGAASAISALVDAQSINGATMTPSGSTETNNAGSTNVLPIYTAITPNGGSQTVCSIKTFGETNKLSVRRFLTFTLANTATLQIQVTGGTDPDLYLYHGGLIDGSFTGNPGVETLVHNSAEPGDYVLDVLEYLNADDDDSTGGTTCLTVTVSAS